MKYGSICSGIEAATVAWHGMAWHGMWFSEIEAFPVAVLKHHYPKIENLGDMTKIHEREVFKNETIDLLVGGTPCQSFSVAGLRKGLADPRGNLALHFLKILDAKRPRWVVWENVPGVLSSSEGRDFGAFLGGLGKLGYGFAYRVLDAQYFGVPQLRRRVFVVGYFGDWRPAAAVLFERKSLSGDSAPSRKAGQKIAPTIRAGAANGGKGHGARSGDSKDELIVPIVTSKWEKGTGGPSGDECQNLLPVIYENHPADSRITECKESGTTVTSRFGTGGGNVPLGSEPKSFTPAEARRSGTINPSDTEPCLTSQTKAGDTMPCIQTAMQVRRLTPRECERLQGFPDDYTLVTFRKKMASDGPRYKALGNSMAVPVMRWIGERIELVENTIRGGVNEK